MRKLKTAADVNAAIGRLGELQRERLHIQETVDGAYADLKAAAEEKAQPLAAEAKALGEGVRAWCEANRAELLIDGAKSASLPAGEVAWRLNPPRVELTAPLADVLAALKKKRLGRFVATKVDLDRQALLKEPAAVAGVPGLRFPDEAERGEKFTINPVGCKLAETVVAPAP